MSRSHHFHTRPRPRYPFPHYRPMLEVLEDRLVPSFIPGQFISKMYTEGLGRAPESTGWQNWVNWFQGYNPSCAITQLDGIAKGIYGSGEYSSRNYTSKEKVLTLYRGILNREPDHTCFTNWVYGLNGRATIQHIVD